MAVRELFAMVYEELKANAHELMQQERSGHTLGLCEVWRSEGCRRG